MVLPFLKEVRCQKRRNFSHEWSGVMSPGLFLCSNQANPNLFAGGYWVFAPLRGKFYKIRIKIYKKNDFQPFASNQTNPNVSKQISVSVWMRLVRNNALSLREKLGQN